MATQVFNQCSVSNEKKDGKIRHDSKEYTVTFNYEFIEDFQDTKGSFFSRLHHRYHNCMLTILLAGGIGSGILALQIKNCLLLLLLLLVLSLLLLLLLLLLLYVVLLYFVSPFADTR